MAPFPQWPRPVRWLVVLVVLGLTALAFHLNAERSSQERPASPRYVKLHELCTQAADVAGLYGRQRVKAVNQCLLDNY